ncbi:MAG: hypothetical protein GY697_14185, partial [Desulfobacterales bacterium]|nr:hypothetical protein [Desulfobacterales bacterium]
YDWCSDQGFTPHLLVDTSIAGVVVPHQLVENDSIVLNIQSTAVRSLELGNEWVMFNARFSGKPMDVSVPVGAVRAIFARENGLGCAFETTVDASPGELEQSPDESDERIEKNPKQQSVDHALKKPGPVKGKADKPTHLKLV